MTFQISKPTRQQIVHGAERTLIVFVLAVTGYLKLSTDPFSKASLSAAGWAGVAAVYQLILSTITTL